MAPPKFELGTITHPIPHNLHKRPHHIQNSPAKLYYKNRPRYLSAYFHYNKSLPIHLNVAILFLSSTRGAPMSEYIPDIEEDIPLPPNVTAALQDMSPAEELAMRARTLKLLADMTDTPIVPDEEDKDVAMEMAKEMMQNPSLRPDYAKYTDETMAYLAGMITQHKVQLVDELSELKMYVVNKLIFEVENAKTSKDRISALTKLGDIDGVDAFKRRTEVTHVVKSLEEVESELLSTLATLKLTAIDADFTEITPDVPLAD